MSRAERIAIVTPRFSEGGTVGGAETLLNQLAGRAAADGRRVTLLTTCARDHFSWKNEWPAGRTRAGALDVIRFAVDERDAAAYHKLDAAMARGETLSADDEQTWIRNSVNCSSLDAHLREHGGEYDRILAGPYLFGVVYSAALIHPDKTLLVPCLHDEPFARLGIMKPLFEKARGCLFNTEPERDFAKGLFQIPDARCRVVGMGIASFDADPGAFARRSGIHGPYVVYSGRREGGKGTPLLCDYMNAFRERTRRDVKLVFTGSGPIEAPTDLLPHITDLGFVSEQEKQEAMAGALAFIHPSVLESLGIVLLEAWMARTPALVHAQSRVLRWQCERSNAGLWFRNYPEFEDELLMLMDRPGLRDALGRNGREYVLREYSWTAVEQRLFDALDNL